MLPQCTNQKKKCFPDYYLYINLVIFQINFSEFLNSIIKHPMIKEFWI